MISVFGNIWDLNPMLTCNVNEASCKRAASGGNTSDLQLALRDKPDSILFQTCWHVLSVRLYMCVLLVSL